MTALLLKVNLNMRKHEKQSKNKLNPILQSNWPRLPQEYEKQGKNKELP